MVRALVAAGVILLSAACQTAPDAPAPSPPACSIAPGDSAWIERALEAWRLVSSEIEDIGAVAGRGVFFDSGCTLTGEGALSHAPLDHIVWTHTPHDGDVTLPNGATWPVGVISMADSEGEDFFLMAVPSVWRAAGVGDANLETTMVAVLLHEGSHLAQGDTFLASFDAIGRRHATPDPWNDDSLQRRFQNDAEFSASVARETALFVAAARAESDAEARRLAREARDLMRSRSRQWYAGEEAYWQEAEDLALTLEGSAQWVSYYWFTHSQGAADPRTATEDRLVRGRWWSQTEGFALAMAVNRLVGPGWLQHAFSDDPRTLLQMLDDELT